MLIAVGLIVVAMSGCKKASENIVEQAMERAIEEDGGGKAKVDIQGEKVTIKTEDGTMEVASGGEATIPAEFPKDVFLVKDAKVSMSMKTPEGVQVVIETKQSVNQAAALYGSEMKKLGWNEEQNVSMGDTAMMSYQKDSREAAIVITKAATGANVQIVTTAR
jgi:hypothetical protein